MIQAYLFDFDGVIVLSEEQKFAQVQSLLQEYGYSLPTSSFSEFVGKKTEYFLSTNYPRMSDIVKKDIVSRRRPIECEIILNKGVSEIFHYLKDHSYKIGIVTGSNNEIVKKSLQSNNLFYLLDVLVTGEHISSKPDPEGYKIAMQKLELRPEEVRVVEDSPAGILAGRSAGCEVWGIRTYLNDIVADRTYNDLEKMLAHLRTELN